MLARWMLAALVTAAAIGTQTGLAPNSAQAQQPGQPSDWQRFYYYPYLYYPHNFQTPQQYDHMYYRYPQSMQIPVYNKDWYNFYPTEKRWHKGHHFILDAI